MGIWEIMEKAKSALGGRRGRGAAAWREHPIQFSTGAGSLYKHKGFITYTFLRKDEGEENDTEGRRDAEMEQGDLQGGGGVQVS